jgi:hypothetical protein
MSLAEWVRDFCIGVAGAVVGGVILAHNASLPRGWLLLVSLLFFIFVSVIAHLYLSRHRQTEPQVEEPARPAGGGCPQMNESAESFDSSWEKGIRRSSGTSKHGIRGL